MLFVHQSLKNPERKLATILITVLKILTSVYKVRCFLHAKGNQKMLHPQNKRRMVSGKFELQQIMLEMKREMQRYRVKGEP